jgi:imidazoleglycerol-phosphate dehydratase
MSHSASRGDVHASCSLVDLGPRVRITTGLPFLDHMVDQLTAHGQLGITLCVSEESPNANGKRARTEYCGEVDYAGGRKEDRPHDADIFHVVGEALGGAIAGLLRAATGGSSTAAAAAAAPVTRRFLAPLDESLAEVVLRTQAGSDAKGTLDYSQAPFGVYPAEGRAWIGSFRTALVESFWSALLEASGLGSLSLRKLRGANAHHIVESSFKAFARALRAVLDAGVQGGVPGKPASGAARAASSRRTTRETEIDLSVDLDATPPPPPEARTGLGSLDRILETLASAAAIRLEVRVEIAMDL